MNIQQFDYSIKLLEVILWRYNNAENVEQLLTKKEQWYVENHTQFWQDWFDDVFNLQTANDFGLSVWSIILNLPLQTDGSADDVDKPIFGFGSESMTPNTFFNFNNGNFSNANSIVKLTTEEKRILLRLRYYQLVSRCAIPEINRSLSIVFKDFPGKVYVLDGLNMSIRIVFTFDPGDRLIALLKQYDLIPRGQGVGISYIVDPGDVFGFGSFNQNFNNGTFTVIS